MSANVETMFYVRETPWHGLGTRVEEAPTSAEALRLAGLDWTVEQHPVQLNGGAVIPGYKANVRSTDKHVLGIVSDRYKIVQNTEAFSFTDELIGGDVRYETAGSLQNGKRVWLLAKMPQTKVAGDEVDPYLCFTNTHDGTGSIRVCMTPIRVVCNNTLNVALRSASRSWSACHIGDMDNKLQEARHCLDLADQYMESLNKYADQLANTNVKEDDISTMLNSLFPVEEDATTRKKKTIEKTKEEFYVCYLRPDIAKFLGTAWGVVNAMSDMVCHSEPHRKTQNYQANNWGRIMDGHKMLDRAVELLTAKH